MLSEGNSSVGACTRNLLSVTQREIPFARSKGINPDVYDMPFDEAQSFLDEYARNVLGAYERRVDVENVELEFGESADSNDVTYTISVLRSNTSDDSDSDWDDE